MKLQIAVDRVPLDKALALADEVREYADVFEIGTSLIKDYGLAAIREVRKVLPQNKLFADLKTVDEGAYEFDAAYNAGADMVSVMGAASIATIAACCETAGYWQRDVLIDLLEVDDHRLHLLDKFRGRLFCLHLSVDAAGENIVHKLESFYKRYENTHRLAVAGGVQQDTLQVLLPYPVEVVVVGSAITKAAHVRTAAREFHEITSGM